MLAHYLQTVKARNTFIQDKNVIELGAGTGIVGLVTALCGAKEIILTDLPELVPLMERNIRANHDKLHANVKACSLRWGDIDDTRKVLMTFKPDCVIVADCVYYKQAVFPLAKTIYDLVSANDGKTFVLCSYEDRDTTDKAELQQEFRRILEEEFALVIRFIPFNEMHAQFRSNDIHIFVISKP